MENELPLCVENKSDQEAIAMTADDLTFHQVLINDCKTGNYTGKALELPQSCVDEAIDMELWCSKISI